jgi:hypothetical protein
MIQFKKYYTLMCRLKDNIYHVCLCSIVVIIVAEEEEKNYRYSSSNRYGRGMPVAFNCFIT